MTRTHYRPEERTAHLTAWKSSGQSKLDYCKQHGIKYLTFSRWVYKSRATSKKLKITKAQKNFIPIQLTESSDVSVQSRTRVEIEFPDGTKLRIN